MMTNLNLSGYLRGAPQRSWTTVGLTNVTYGPNSSCNCLTNPSCLQPVTLGAWNFNDQDELTLPGLYLGCYVFEAILRSSLRCFYLRPCIQVMIAYISIGERPNINPQPLEVARNILYTINSTVDEMLDRMMVETWAVTISSRAHFDACRPESCTYSFVARHDLIYIITILLGIVGGLSKILRWTVPYAVLLGFRIVWRR